MNRAVAVLDISDGGILLVRNSLGWLFPGGKVEEGESEEECARREVKEELNDAILREYVHYRTYQSINPKDGKKINVLTGFCRIVGDLRATSEIIEVARTREPEKYELIPLARKIINDLREEGYL